MDDNAVKKSGKIKVVNSRGFGFITDDNEIDFFFHWSAYNGGKEWKKLVATFVNNPGRELKVEFDIDETATQAPRAINVRLI